jgi:hypothetical protein
MLIFVNPQSRLKCDMSIIKYSSRTVESKMKPVQVEAAGRDGLRFVTELRMPPDPKLLLSFSVAFQNKSARQQGRIVTAQSKPDGRYAYEVRFDRLQERGTETGWLELLLGLSAYQQMKYMQAGGAYQALDDRRAERAEFDVRA